MSGYQRLEFDVSTVAEPRLVGELWSAGILGLESREMAHGMLRIVAYFDEARRAEACAERVGEVCAGVVLRDNRRQEDADWLAAYRRRAKPFALGSRLVVDPGEPAADLANGPDGAGRGQPDGRRRLRLPARRAFGTGEHASTRLAVELLEQVDPAGSRVLDLGCGSGILSFAATLWGARSVVAVEIDPAAAMTARANRGLNDIDFPLVAGRAGCLGRDRTFDLVLANVLPENLRPDLPDLRRLLAPGGRVVFSGILSERVAEIEGWLAGHGLHSLARREHEEWTALLCGTRPEPSTNEARPPC